MDSPQGMYSASGAEQTAICEALQGPVLTEERKSQFLQAMNLKLGTACEGTDCCGDRPLNVTFCEEQMRLAFSDLDALVNQNFPGFQYVSHMNSFLSRSPLEIIVLNSMTQRKFFLIVSHNNYYFVSVAVEAEAVSNEHVAAIFECGQCVAGVSDFCEKDFKVLPSCGQRVRDWQAAPENTGKVVEAAHCVWGDQVIAGYPNEWQRIDTEVSTWDCQACFIKAH